MYSNKMAVAIKSNNKVLKEVDGKVYIPFGSEYSVFLKNLNNRKALVNVTIDGLNATTGGLILDKEGEPL